MSKTKQNIQQNNNSNIKFSLKSKIILSISVFIIIIGFILTAIGDIYIAPILLTIGYIVLIPIGLLKK